MPELKPMGGGRSRQNREEVGRLSSPVVIGRDGELAVLLEAALNPPAAAFVRGEAGVGKSRLVQELVGDAGLAGRRTLIGRCHPLREPFLLGSILEALQGAEGLPPGRLLNPVVGALRPLLPELAGQLPPHPSPLGDPRAERHRVFRGLRELLRVLGPAVFVLDDLHWADEGTLEFLSFLLSQPPAQLAVIVTYRGEEVDPSSPLVGLASRLSKETFETNIELSPLSGKQVGRLVGVLLEKDDVSEGLATYVLGQTAGIPFAIEEVVRLLIASGDLSVLEHGRAPLELEEVGVPAAIRSSVLARVGPLSADARLLARAAAVLGVSADEDLLRRVAGLAPVRATKGLLEALHAAVLVETTSVYGFRHTLAAQAVYEDIPGPQRQWLHLRAARALASGLKPRPLVQLAHHFRQADRPRDSARCAESAAEAASCAGDDRVAARLLEQALSLRNLPRAARIRMAIRLGIAALYSVSPEPAIGLLQRTLDEEPLPAGVRGELRFSLSRLRCHAGRTWREEMLQAVEDLRGRPELAARAMVNLALPSLRDGELGDHLTWLGRAVRTVVEEKDRVAKTAVFAQRAAILIEVGDPTGWSAIDDIPYEARSVEEKLQLLRGYNAISLAALGVGHYDRAKCFLAKATKINAELSHVWWELWLGTARVSIDWATGRWDGLEPRARELAANTAGMAILSPSNQIVLGSLLLSAGELDEAERTLVSALELAQATQSVSWLVAAAGRLARLHLAREDAQAAGPIAQRGLDVVRRKGIWTWATNVAPAATRAFLACGHDREARDLTREFSAGLRGRDAPAARAALALCQGALSEKAGRHERAARSLGRAQLMLRALPAPYEAALAQERQAHSLLSQAPTRATGLLFAAFEAFDGLGASWDAARIRAELRARQVALPYPWRGGRRRFGSELSPREAEVARLAGKGRTNQEIAEALFISRRTVEVHVAAARRKLGVSSRQALAPDRKA